MQVRENLPQAASHQAADADRRAPRSGSRIGWQALGDYSLIAIFVVMFVTMSLTVDHFFSIDNMLGLALSI
jgi:L-arabinose transport system permease protein